MMQVSQIKFPISGIFLLNKPQGLTSNSALQKVKRLFNAKKAGHTGSLDPLATGMLPICFGEATKICQYLLDADKCYQTTGYLGIKTNTSDSTGEITQQVKAVNVTQQQLEDALARYRGAVKQTPSMFSALKHKGTPLYKFARSGIDIERDARDIFISTLNLTHFNGLEFSLTVCCSKGTYIRNLVEDIGDDLQVGAHLTMLHRLYTSGFEHLPMYTLEQLESMSATEKLNSLIPMDKAVDYLPSLTLSAEEVIILQQGKILTNKAFSDAPVVRLYDACSQFIGLGQQLHSGDIKAKRLLSF